MSSVPQFLLIGAQKAGTTALSAYLDQHPEIFIPLNKEPSHFAFAGNPVRYEGPGDDYANRDFVFEWEAYQRLFNGVRPGQQAGEASVLYLYVPGTAERIKERVPEVKLIVMLRNPVDRAYSAYMHLRRDGRETETDFAMALKREDSRIANNWEMLWHYRAGGCYADQLERFLSVFPREQLFICLSDDMKRDLKGLLRRVFEFLDVDPDIEVDTSFRMNESGLARNQTFNHLLNKPSLIKEIFKRVVPMVWARRLKSRLQKHNLEAAPEMDSTLRAELASYYRSDIDRLETLIGRDLSAWKS